MRGNKEIIQYNMYIFIQFTGLIREKETKVLYDCRHPYVFTLEWYTSLYLFFLSCHNPSHAHIKVFTQTIQTCAFERQKWSE